MLGANAYANADDFVSYEGKPPRPAPSQDLYGLGATYRLYPAAAGWVFLGLVQEREWDLFCTLVDRPALTGDTRFATAAGRSEHEAELAEALAALFLERPADDWEALLAPKGLGCVRADGATVGEFIATDAHVRANGLRVPVHNANFGEYERYGPLTDFSATPLELGGFPLAGEQSDAILGALGYSAEAIVRLREAGVVWSESARAFRRNGGKGLRSALDLLRPAPVNAAHLCHHSKRMSQPATGRLLVATPNLEEPNFRRTVILLCAHSEEGTFGLVLNRPLPERVADHLPEWGEFVSEPSVLFRGGARRAGRSLRGRCG